MRKLTVIHFNPIEMYPPVLNWLNYLSGQTGEPVEVRVYTMALPGSDGWFVPASPNIKIIRAGRFGEHRSWERYLGYLFYYLKTLFGLLRWKPGSILYYETISSLPALIYKKYINHRTNLFIHYHEYTSVAEYERGMVLSRHLHKLERKMYASAKWLSQTNEDRVACFKKDLQGVPLPALHLLPNYPPAGWKKVLRADRPSNKPLRIVYIGALSLDTMYTRAFADWVLQQSGNVIWDIYTTNISGETRSFLDSVDNDLIRFRGGVDYFSLPSVLPAYDIGIILYMGHIPNYIYNAPNKLFEYLACGLDVWFPDQLKGSFPYITTGTWPRVMSLDFSALSGFKWQEATDHAGLSFQPRSYYCEEVLDSLWQELLTN